MYGGHILFKRYPKNKIFLYGRYSLADAAMIDLYYDLLEGNPLWREWFEYHDVKIVFLGRTVAGGSALIFELSRANDWNLVYVDEKAMIFIKDIPEFAHVRQRFNLQRTE
jgi:hypothetical protein